MVFGIRFGNWEELISREACSFCSFLQKVARQCATLTGNIPSVSSIITLNFERTREEFRLLPLRILVVISSLSERRDENQFEIFLDGKDVAIFKDERDRKSDGITLVEPLVLWEKVRNWLDDCASNHENCASSAKVGRLPQGFRVIDVEDKCLVSGFPGCRYVALSYVWGYPGEDELKATSSTIRRLLQKGSLTSQLPQTITDAMQVCRELGKRYLWADRLCIIQDDACDKQNQIGAMDSIYRLADFSVIASDGVDMNSGIPGVQRARVDFPQLTTHFCGLSCTLKLPGFSDAIPYSIWSSRGWTYQEAVLCRRKLYFSKFQAYYVCEEMRAKEDLLASEGESMRLWRTLNSEPKLLMSDAEKAAPFLYKNYSRHLGLYTQRHLTYDSDIYNAFLGISSALFGSNDSLLCGLPKTYFDRALLWYPDTYEKDQVAIRDSADVPVPSWSWSSRTGMIYAPIPGYTAPLVRWAVGPDFTLSPNGQQLTEWNCTELAPTDGYEQPTDSDGGEMSFAAAIAWNKGCFEKKWPLQISLEHSTMEEYREALLSRWPRQRDLWSEIWSEPPDSTSTDNSPAIMFGIPPHIQKGTLKTRAQSGNFRLKHHDHHGFCYDPLLEILDEDGRCIGLLQANDPRVRAEIEPRMRLRNARFELVAISLQNSYMDVELACLFSNRMELSGADELENLERRKRLGVTFADREGTCFELVTTVSVMLIGRRGPFAYRISIGWVLLTKWVESNTVFKTLYLV